MLRMKNIIVIAFLFILLVGSAFAAKKPDAQHDQSVKEIEAFNVELDRVTLAMDNAGVMALWDVDGVTLLPGSGPTEGKQTIARWLDGVTSNMKGFHVIKQQTVFHDITARGDVATEWGTTTQVVQTPDGKTIETHGKILLVLRKQKDGSWKIREEMWNSA